MTNEEGLKLKVGEMVWAIGSFEQVYMPYRIAITPVLDGRNVFTEIISEDRFEDGLRNHGERMNTYYLSRKHPRGWKFVKEQKSASIKSTNEESV